MVISINPEPPKKSFQQLLADTVSNLEFDARHHQSNYLELKGTKLESAVAGIMSELAIGTPFENSIELISGQRFPDIIAKKFYGVEVKTTTQNHWTTTGNSVLEGTRVEGIERIFILFGKLFNPVEFKCRPYEECLSEVVVTHSPRYLINMDLAEGQTIFDKLNIDYDTLRLSNNPVKSIIEYYRKFLRPGEEVWWIDQDESKSTGMIIQLWNNLSADKKKELKLKGMILFPEIFSKRNDKFNRLAVWLVNSCGVVCPNIRDMYTSGGQGQISWNGKTYTGIPKIIIKMKNCINEILSMLENMSNEELSTYWEIASDNRLKSWIDLVDENSKSLHLPINLAAYLSYCIQNRYS
ncbi:MAG: hypothetical protein WC865_14130 [Bacteroidales bacterium]